MSKYDGFTFIVYIIITRLQMFKYVELRYYWYPLLPSLDGWVALCCCTSFCVAKYHGPMDVFFSMSLKES